MNMGLTKENCWLVLAVILGTLILFKPAFGGQENTAAIIPETIILKILQKEYLPVRFGHKIHIQKVEGCNNCHHHTSARETRECAECHDLKKAAMKKSLVEGFLPCKSCHRKYSPSSPSMPGLKTALHIQCFTCHKERDNIIGPKSCVQTCHALADKGG